MESELSARNHNSLKYDFEKLLLANADMRVMICFGEGNFTFPKNINQLIDLFEKSYNSYLNLKPNSRTLLLVWDDYMTGNIFPYLLIK